MQTDESVPPPPPPSLPLPSATIDPGYSKSLVSCLCFGLQCSVFSMQMANFKGRFGDIAIVVVQRSGFQRTQGILSCPSPNDVAQLGTTQILPGHKQQIRAWLSTEPAPARYRGRCATVLRGRQGVGGGGRACFARDSVVNRSYGKAACIADGNKCSQRGSPTLPARGKTEIKYHSSISVFLPSFPCLCLSCAGFERRAGRQHEQWIVGLVEPLVASRPRALHPLATPFRANACMGHGRYEVMVVGSLAGVSWDEGQPRSINCARSRVIGRAPAPEGMFAWGTCWAVKDGGLGGAPLRSAQGGEMRAIAVLSFSLCARSLESNLVHPALAFLSCHLLSTSRSLAPQLFPKGLYLAAPQDMRLRLRLRPRMQELGGFLAAPTTPSC